MMIVHSKLEQFRKLSSEMEWACGFDHRNSYDVLNEVQCEASFAGNGKLWVNGGLIAPQCVPSFMRWLKSVILT